MPTLTQGGTVSVQARGRSLLAGLAQGEGAGRGALLADVGLDGGGGALEDAAPQAPHLLRLGQREHDLEGDFGIRGVVDDGRTALHAGDAAGRNPARCTNGEVEDQAA